MDLRSLRYFAAVAEERHFGRAAARLHMTQPPLSPAIKQLETDVGALLMHRSPAGVTLRPAGTTLYDEARALLEHAEHARARVAATAGTATFTIGTLADSAEEADTGLADAFRLRNPGVRVRIREGDFTDPTAGLRAGRVDVALTRMPFDRTGVSIRVLRSDPVGVVLRADDPLARRDTLQVSDLDDRRWFQFPEGTDSLWRAYWTCTTPSGTRRDGPVVRTASECVQAVFWNGAIGLAPLAPQPHAFPQGLTVVPLADMMPSRLVVAWNKADANPLIRSLVQIAATVYRSRPAGLRDRALRTASHAIYELVAVPAVGYQEYCVPFQVDRIEKLLICRLDCFFRDANGPENVKEVFLRQCGWPRRWLRAFPGRDPSHRGRCARGGRTARGTGSAHHARRRGTRRVRRWAGTAARCRS